jgi:DNA-binding transcriptional ArsR family regulator
LKGTSQKSRSRSAGNQGSHAQIFAALGDGTRLRLLAKLCRGQAHSISQLTQGSRVTRQAITKHLRVLESAGIVRGVRTGRQRQFALNPRPVEDARKYLDLVSAQWDRRLGRLKSLVES